MRASTYQPSGKGVDCKSYWFYVGNFESPLPEGTPGAPQGTSELDERWAQGSQVQKLRGALERLKKIGVTGDSVVYSFLGRRIQPLQRRVNPGFRYEGVNDPSRFSP